MRKGTLSFLIFCSLMLFVLIQIGCDTLTSIAKGIALCLAGNEKACKCWDISAARPCDSDPNWPPPAPDDPDYPPGTGVDIRCDGPSFKARVSGKLSSASGYLWLALEDKSSQSSDEILSISQAVRVSGETFTGLWMRVPLGGLDLQNKEYDVGLYFCSALTDVGSPKKSIVRDDGNLHVTFTEMHRNLAKFWVSKASFDKALAANNDYCIFNGDSIEFTAICNDASSDSQFIEVVEGHSYYSNGVTWRVEGQLTPPAGSISSNGLFIAEYLAVHDGDCMVIGHDNSNGLEDTVDIFIFDKCESSIYIAEGDNAISPGECVYIDSTPQMPDLKFMLDPPNSGEQFSWTLSIKYNRSGRNDYKQYHTLLYGNETWILRDSLKSDIIGGEAQIACSSLATGCMTGEWFSIRGRNATEAEVESYITNLPGNLWYWKYVARHESDKPTQGRYHCQFNEKGDFSCDPSDVRYTPNASGDSGFGIFQLTWFDYPTRVPNIQELWSWKGNVNSGTEWLRHHQSHTSGANEYMQVERAQALSFASDSLHPPIEVLGNVTFRDGTDKFMEHAVAIKRFNGTGGGGNGQYCEWDETNHSWVIHKLNNYDPPFNYVERVCLTYP
ncbi:hypothetical protein TRIP_C20151 [Candidatus Zixiibacteriota bacterium]|nr:hypothetical protein TRIP_C20151 [candidate division Zixibacteria bacterium]